MFGLFLIDDFHDVLPKLIYTSYYFDFLILDLIFYHDYVLAAAAQGAIDDEIFYNSFEAVSKVQVRWNTYKSSCFYFLF